MPTALEQCVPVGGRGLGSVEEPHDYRAFGPAIRFARSGTLVLGGTDKQSLSVAPRWNLNQPIEPALTERERQADDP